MEWVKCPHCKHKLFRFYPGETNYIDIEIKCSSCKKIVELNISADECSFITRDASPAENT